MILYFVTEAALSQFGIAENYALFRGKSQVRKKEKKSTWVKT